MTDVTTLEAGVDEDLKTLAKILEDRKTIAQNMIPFDQLAISQVGFRMGKIKEYLVANDKEKKLKPEDLTEEKMFAAALKSENWVKLAQNDATQLAKFSKCFKSYKFKVRLPGFDAQYKALEDDGEDTEKAEAAGEVSTPTSKRRAA